jgi:hypothetical protein
LSQVIPKLYGGDVLGAESEISEDVMNILKILKKIVLNFNKNPYIIEIGLILFNL